jgi:hypothetical protein
MLMHLNKSMYLNWYKFKIMINYSKTQDAVKPAYKRIFTENIFYVYGRYSHNPSTGSFILKSNISLQ